MEKIILYTNPQSRGVTVEWVIEELGLDVEKKIIEYSEMKSEEYLNINPMGKVPTLKYGNTIITETIAICLFLAELVPEKKLIPNIIEAKGSFYRWLFFGNTLEYAMLEKKLNIKVPDESRRSIGYGSLEQVLVVLKKELASKKYLCGEFSLADIIIANYLYKGINFMKTIDNNILFDSYIKNIQDRPAYKKVFKS